MVKRPQRSVRSPSSPSRLAQAPGKAAVDDAARLVELAAHKVHRRLLKMEFQRTTEMTAQLMVKNEEYWVGPVLSSLLECFEKVLVADCGSKDRTLEIIKSLQRPGMEIMKKGELTPAANGLVREELRKMTQTPWSFLCDGDEYYPVASLKGIVMYPIPEGKGAGFTPLRNVVWVHDKRVMKLTMGSRLCVYRTQENKWTGAYPADRPVPAADDRNLFFYYPSNFVGYHLRYVPRSPLDSTTYLRDRHDDPLTELVNSSWSNPILEHLRSLGR